MSTTQGQVKWFNDAKGYGFIQVEGVEKDIFVHHTCIQAEGFRSLTQGETVLFDLVEGPKGPKAENVLRQSQLQSQQQPQQQARAS